MITRIVPWSPDLPLDQVMAQLSLVQNRVAVRITGGCGDMSPHDAKGVQELFRTAFRGFRGVALIGGTRMIRGMSPSDVVFGITEIGSAIRHSNPDCLVLGIVPRCKDFAFCPDPPLLIVRREPHKGYTTVVHPDQDIVIVASTPLTKDEVWDDEIACCQYLTDVLVTYGQWRSLLIAYNGGSATEKETRSTASRGWPVLLIKGSGRICDTLADDATFLQEHPTIHVCERSSDSLRSALQHLSVVDA